MCSGVVCAQQALQAPANINQLVDQANRLIKQGVPAPQVDAWLKGQSATLPRVEVTPLAPVPAPPAWNAYAVAAWQGTQSAEGGTGIVAGAPVDAYVAANASATSKPAPATSAAPAAAASTAPTPSAGSGAASASVAPTARK